MIPLLTLLSCGGPEEPAASRRPDLAALDAPLLLRRMSLDLRGVLPSVEELDDVEGDPDRLADYREAFLADARLEDRLVSFFAEHWLTRLDIFEVRYYDYGFSDEEEFAFERSVSDEPLRLMARIAVEDRPWTEIVTADYTVVNEMLASIWPLQYPEDGEGWEKATWTDGRPAVGVLATNGLWWRYVSNTSNMNRARAAALSRLLLCQDLLSRPVSLSGAVSLAEEDSVAAAIRSNDACVACHSSVDPLAATLFGWWVAVSYNPDEMGIYHGEREDLGSQYLEVEPGYFGQPVQGLVDVGPAIAGDSRFVSCTVQTAAKLLWRREVEPEDFAAIEALRQSFVDSGLLYRDLLRALLQTPEYQVGAFTDQATDAVVERELNWRLLTPDQVDSAVADLTGFSWYYEGFNQLANDEPGYRVLAGGIDGYAVTRPQHDPGITWSLTFRRHAQAAASYAVTEELENGGQRRLLQHVTAEDRPGDEAFTRELRDLHWRLYARRPDADRLAADEAYWSAVEAEEGAVAAWASLVSVMLRDPAFLGY